MPTTRPSGWVVPAGDDSHVTEAIISACLQGSVEIFEQLHDASASHLIPPASYLVRCAAASKQLPMLSYILRLYPPRRLKADETKMDTLPYWDRISLLDQSIIWAIIQGDIAIVKRLLQAGMPVERFLEHGTELTIEHLLRIAIERNQIEIAHLLLERRADPNRSCNCIGSETCTDVAALRGSNDMLQLVLEYGSKVENCGLLWKMAESGESVENAQTLFDLGANINEIYTYPYHVIDKGTALHAAAGVPVSRHDKSAKFAEWLLQNGIDHTIKDGAGQTALQIAQEKGHKQVEILIANWIREHSKQEFSPRRLRSSKRGQSLLWELQTPKKRKIQGEPS